MVKAVKGALDNLKRAKREGWAEWIRTKSDREAVRQGCYFDLNAADRVRRFCLRCLKHYKGRRFKGKPFALLDWQWRDVIAPLFGWKQADGLRRFRRAFITVAKKNGKTALTAAIALYCLLSDNEPGARVYLAANDRKQAGLCFSDCAAMARHSPKITERVNISDSARKIKYPATESLLEALSADVATNEGLDASVVILDELHMAKARTMFDVLEHAGSAREQPLFIITTTAGDASDSICFEEYCTAKDILSGKKIDVTYLACVYEAGAEANLDDPKTWHAANPSLGETIPIDNFKRDLDTAKQRASKLYNFRRRRLNQWAKAPSQFVSAAAWDACKGTLPDSLAAMPMFVGLDLGDNSDLNAMLELFVIDDTVYVRATYWAPEETIDQRIEEGKTHYREWRDKGYIIATDGASTDFPAIKAHVLSRAERNKVIELAYDPYQALNLIGDLTASGITCTKVPQTTPHIAPAMSDLERRILDRKIVHDGNPVLAWNIGNLKPKIDAHKNMMPDKKKSEGKIDGATALITGLSRAMLNSTKKPSVYERRGPICI